MSEIALVNSPNVGLDKTQKGGPYVNELSTLNLGPKHPATHVIFQNILTMD
jgi:NADH-quinone oxidoreductase subunit D